MAKEIEKITDGLRAGIVAQMPDTGAFGTPLPGEGSSIPVTASESSLFGSIGAMEDCADELDEIVEDAVRQRRAGAWLPDPKNFAALEALSEETSESLTILLNEAIRLLLEHRRNPPLG
jgi:hypothetical protein